MILNESEGGWTKAPPAGQAAVGDLVAGAKTPLPVDYLAFLGESNGGEGELAVEPGWFVIWPAEEVLQRNAGYRVPETLAGFLAFGSSGGGEMLAFDTRRGLPYPVVAVPFIPMEADQALVVAQSFGAFRLLIGGRTPVDE
jgi:hypothetical protein